MKKTWHYGLKTQPLPTNDSLSLMAEFMYKQHIFLIHSSIRGYIDHFHSLAINNWEKLIIKYCKHVLLIIILKSFSPKLERDSTWIPPLLSLRPEHSFSQNFTNNWTQLQWWKFFNFILISVILESTHVPQCYSSYPPLCCKSQAILHSLQSRSVCPIF